MALTSAQGHLLPCGRLLEDIWDRRDAVLATTSVDEHERTCPHCQTARVSLHRLAEATRAVYEDRSLVPPTTLQGQIMAAVRAEVRRRDRLPLAPGVFGPVDISEQAVAVVLRFAADTVDGVRARRCRLHHPEPLPTAEPARRSATAPGPVRVDLSIAIRYGPSTTLELVDRVRTRVAAAATAQVGVHLLEINVEVEDVYHDNE